LDDDDEEFDLAMEDNLDDEDFDLDMEVRSFESCYLTVCLSHACCCDVSVVTSVNPSPSSVGAMGQLSSRCVLP
jgi:hypothetical protein